MASVLYLLRHAEAVSSVPGGRDRDRPLSERGVAQAVKVAAELRGLLAGDRIDRVLCSPSVRTRQTLEAVVEAGLVRGSVEFEQAVYDAGSDTLLELLGLLDASVETVLLVGHAPGVPALCWELADPSESDPEAMESLERGFPPATLARLELGVAWSSVGPGAGRLTHVVVTR